MIRKGGYQIIDLDAVVKAVAAKENISTDKYAELRAALLSGKPCWYCLDLKDRKEGGFVSAFHIRSKAIDIAISVVNPTNIAQDLYTITDEGAITYTQIIATTQA